MPNQPREPREPDTRDNLRGYDPGSVDTVISVDDVALEAERLAAEGPSRDDIAALASGTLFLDIDSLVAGYGKMEILHQLDLQVAKGQSLCLIGPHGAGKSTVLHSIYGFTNMRGGTISVDGA